MQFVAVFVVLFLTFAGKLPFVVYFYSLRITAYCIVSVQEHVFLNLLFHFCHSASMCWHIAYLYLIIVKCMRFLSNIHTHSKNWTVSRGNTVFQFSLKYIKLLKSIQTTKNTSPFLLLSQIFTFLYVIWLNPRMFLYRANKFTKRLNNFIFFPLLRLLIIIIIFNIIITIIILRIITIIIFRVIIIFKIFIF